MKREIQPTQNGETRIGIMERYAFNGVSDIKTPKTMALIELLSVREVGNMGR